MSDSKVAPLWYLSVELVPPRSLVAELKDMRAHLPSDLNFEVIAGTAKYPFHLTLLFTVILHTQAQYFKSRVEEICRRYPPLSLSFHAYRMFPDGSLALLARRDQMLMHLHADLVGARRPLGWPHAYRQELEEYFTVEEFGRFIRVGDPYALRLFCPHITIARLRDGSHSIPLPPVSVRRPFSFRQVRMRAWTSESGRSRRLACFSLAEVEL